MKACRLLLTVLLPVFGLAGCSSFGDSEYQDELIVEVQFNKSVYQPGEAVVATVQLHNRGEQVRGLRRLDANSVQMAYGRLGDTETPVFRQPIHSAREALRGMIELQPGQSSTPRQFVFTRLTQHTGAFTAQVHYDPNPPEYRLYASKEYSNIQNFEVAGRRIFNRDASGLILERDAIEVAKADVGGMISEAQAIPVEDETTGFYLFWVNVTSMVPDENGIVQPRTVARMVDPYLGNVKGEAVPFNPSADIDRRTIPPGELPPKPTGMASPGR